MGGVEELGLLKMDFLGLRNLDVITDSIELIKEFRGVEVDIDDLPLDDDETLALLRRGESIGVFQLEGGPDAVADAGARPDVVRRRRRPRRLVPARARWRRTCTTTTPTARTAGSRSSTSIPTPRSCSPTPGACPIFQEQIMRVAQKFAGYSLAEADTLRKSMGKKSRALMAKERANFEAGCERTGLHARARHKPVQHDRAVRRLRLQPKSHSYGYGLVAYQTAYLKAHYPIEYLAALLTSVKSSLEKAAVYLSECRAMGIQVLVPDVNRSQSDFVPARLDDGTEVIPFGLSAVRNVGEGLVELILAERERGGPFADFYDFCDRVDLQVLNKRTIESLIKAGAFDSLGHPRRGLLAVHEAIIDKTVARRREHDMGVMTLFGPSSDSTVSPGSSYDDRPEVLDIEFDKRERLAFEKEMLGLYVSDHPLLGAEAALRRKTDGTLADAIEAEEHAIKAYGGVITNLQRKWTRAQDLMAVFTLEDLQGTMEVMVFPKTMAVVGHKLVDDAVVVVKGKLDKREEQPKLVALDVEVFEGVDRRRPAGADPAAGRVLRADDRAPQGAAVRAPRRVPGVPPRLGPPGRAAARQVLRRRLPGLRRRGARPVRGGLPAVGALT